MNEIRQEPEDDIFDGYEVPQNLPNTPMNQMTNEILKTLLSTDKVPEKQKDDWWYILTNDLPLTFVTEETKREKMMDYDIVKLEKLKSIPYVDYDFKTEEEFSKMRAFMDIRLDRAKGFKDGQKNERILQQSQFSENKIVQESNIDRRSDAGNFFQRLLGRGAKR